MKINYPVGLLTNVKAKKIRKIKIKPSNIVDIIGKKNCISKVTSSMNDLKKAIEDFREKDIKIILSNGGDGTHQKLISTLIYHFRDYSPVIVPLKGGTMNMLSKNLNLNKNPYSVARWIKRIEEEKTNIDIKFKRVLCIDSDSFKEKKYGFTFIAGCAYKILNLYYSYPEGGKRSAAKAIFSTMSAWLKKDKKAKDIYSYTNSKTLINGKIHNFKYLITLASTLERLILGFSPFGNLKLNTKNFYLIYDGEAMHKNFNPFKFFKIDNTEEWLKKRIVAKAEKLELDVEGGFSLDGELIKTKGNTRLKITKGSNIKFLAM